MKFEEQIKNSLNNHEEAYNPAAWDAMKAKLDAKNPVAPKGGNGKWWIAAGIAVVAVTSLLIWNNSTKTTNQIAEQTQENVSEDSGRIDSNTKNNPQSTSTNDLAVQSEEGNSETVQNSSESTEVVELIESSVSDLEIGETNLVSDSQTNPTSERTQDGNSNGEIEFVDYMYTSDPSIETMNIITDHLCLGKNYLTNSNKYDLVVKNQEGKIVGAIPAKTDGVINIPNEGKYQFFSKQNGKLYEGKTYIVDKAPEISIQQIHEDIKFENGLPIVHFVSNDEITWSANGQTVSGKEAKFHFFKQGNQSIELTKAYGQCTASEQITVPVEKYNLLAPTAFNPNGFNKTFIPKALELRDVKFKMIIIDLATGGLVYETTSSEEPWDGVDVRTGRVSPSPTNYAWKVQILNPEKGESSNYQGTVRKL